MPSPGPTIWPILPEQMIADELRWKLHDETEYIHPAMSQTAL